MGAGIGVGISMMVLLPLTLMNNLLIASGLISSWKNMLNSWK